MSIATITIYSCLKYSSKIQRKEPKVKRILAALQYHTVTSLIGRRRLFSLSHTVVANAQTNIIAKIEKPEAIENIDAIFVLPDSFCLDELPFIPPTLSENQIAGEWDIFELNYHIFRRYGKQI